MEDQHTKQYPKIPIFNLDTEDFTTTYDIHGTSIPVSFTAPAQQITYFEEPVAKHLAKHLAKHMLNKREVGAGYYEAEYDSLISVIMVNV